MATQRTDFDFDCFMRCARILLEMSDREMEPYVRERLAACVESGPTPRELYDCLDWVSKQPCDRVVMDGVRFVIGNVSGFVQSACDVTRWYQRPAV